MPSHRTTFNSVSHCCKKIAQDRSSYSFLVFYGKLIPYLKMSKHFLKCFRISTIDLKNSNCSWTVAFFWKMRTKISAHWPFQNLRCQSTSIQKLFFKSIQRLLGFKSWTWYGSCNHVFINRVNHVFVIGEKWNTSNRT